MKLKDQVILIGGGGTGIGRATAVALAQQGAKIAIGDLNLAAAQETAQAINDSGGEAVAIGYDQSDEESICALVAKAVSGYGQLNGVFANVADLQVIMEDTDILSMDLSVWQRSLNVNVIGTNVLIRESLPHLLAQKGGSIVCTSSTASTIGENVRPAYAASKAAINAICRHVSSRWGQEGIRCNALAPGFILTETAQNNMPQEVLDRMVKGYNSARHGSPDDIASAVAFLMSDEGSWVNGQVWHINGGIHYAN